MSSLSRYITGFVLSIGLTLVPLICLTLGFGSATLYVFFVGCAVAQLLVQLYFFLHVGEEASPGFGRMALYFAILTVAILVGGTLWIMHDLEQGHSGHGQPFENGVVTPQTEG